MARPRRPPSGRCNAPRTEGKPGKPCPCPASPTATSVVSRPTPQTPTWCWPVACMASCFGAITVGTRGRRFGKSSARCGHWRGCHPNREEETCHGSLQTHLGGFPYRRATGYVYEPHRAEVQGPGAPHGATDHTDGKTVRCLVYRWVTGGDPRRGDPGRAAL